MTTAAPPDTDVDTSDLDLLDDDRRHARCLICYPHVPLGGTFIALCGRRALRMTDEAPLTIPTNACPDCARLFGTVSCPNHGTRA